MLSRGSAAMVLSFDVAPDAVVEHDHWHTHEHMPERLSIPGFVHGTRWVSSAAKPRYLVIYEVGAIDVLASPAYLERLNNPSPWTTKMMPHYIGMKRAFCDVAAAHGRGMGSSALALIFAGTREAHASALRAITALLPDVVQRPGVSSAHVLRAALNPQMTREQQIRGTDSGLAGAVLVTGYDAESLRSLADGVLAPERLGEKDGALLTGGMYQLAFALPSNHGATA